MEGRPTGEEEADIVADGKVEAEVDGTADGDDGKSQTGG